MNAPYDRVLGAFLDSQFKAGMELAAASDLLQLRPVAGLPPFGYMARYACRGLARDQTGAVLEHDQWDIGIQFPPGYLRGPVHPAQVLTFLGVGESPDLAPWHPNIKDNFICMEVYPGMPLSEILYALHDLLTWRLYATRDEGLNHAAAQFARNQLAERFPVDRRPLKRRPDVGFKIEEIGEGG